MGESRPICDILLKYFNHHPLFEKIVQSYNSVKETLRKISEKHA